MSTLPVVGARLSVEGTREFSNAFHSASGVVGSFANAATARFKAIGAGMVVIGGTILAAGKAFATGAADFEKAMRNVQTISVAAQQNFQRFGDQVYDVARITNQSGREAAEGLYEIVSSGFDGAEALQVLKESSIAASAGLTDVFTSAKAVTAVLNAYGASGDRAQQVSDILFQTVNLGVGSFEELAGSVGQVVGLASQSGVAFEEVGAALAATSRSGIAFDEAATGVNRILQELLDPTDQLRELLHQLGYETGLQALRQDGLYGVLEKIRGELGGNASAYVTLFGRIEATRTALALGANDGVNFSEAMDKIADGNSSAGAAARAFRIQQQSLNAKTKDLQNSIESFGTSALLPLLIILNKGEGVLRKFIDLMDKLAPPIKAGIGIATIFAGVILTALGAAFLLLPRLILVAAFAMIRYNQATREAISTALALASSNSILAASARQVFMAVTDARLITGIAKGIGKWSLAIGLLTAGMSALAQESMKTEEIVARLANSATNAEITNFVKQFANDLKDYDAALVGIDPRGAIDAIFGTELDTVTRSNKSRKAFSELARSNREVAVRILQSAEAAGVNAKAIEFMQEELKKADQAAKDTGDSVASLTAEYTTSSGQIIMVTDDVKESLEDFRDLAQDLRNGFGGLFADPTEEAEQLAAAVEAANRSVLDAERDLINARETQKEDALEASQAQARSARNLTRARRDLAAIELKQSKPQRGESAEEFELRISNELEDARQRVADAEEGVTGSRRGQRQATERIIELEQRLVDAREKEKKAAEAQIVTADKLLASIRAQNEVLQNLFTNFATLRQRGFTEPMLAELRELGPQGAAQVAALTKATDAELQEYRRLWMENVAIASGIAINPLETNPAAVQAKLAEIWEQTGGDVARFMQLGAAAGMEALERFVTEKFKAAGSEAAKGIYAALPPEIQVKLRILPADEASAATLRALTGGGVGPGALGEGELNLRAEESRKRRQQGPRPFAQGDIVTKPTLGLFGEAGAEVVIPLTKPQRAMELMKKSGLLALVRQAQVPTYAAGGIIGARSIPNYSVDRSSKVGYTYEIGQVVANDPVEFSYKMRQQQRTHALMGLES